MPSNLPFVVSMSCRCRISHIGQAADNAQLIGYFRLNVNSRRSCLFGMIIKTSSTYSIKMRRWGAATQMATISHMILFRKVQFQTCQKSCPRNGKVGWYSQYHIAPMTSVNTSLDALFGPTIFGIAMQTGRKLCYWWRANDLKYIVLQATISFPYLIEYRIMSM